MDIEWARTRRRPHLHLAGTARDREEPIRGARVEHRYKLKGSGTVLAEGRAIGQKIGTGPVRIRALGERDRTRAARRRARHRHDRSQLGAGDEEGERDRPPTAAVAPAMPRSSRANWVFRRWWVAAMRPNAWRRRPRHGGVLRRRHRLRLRWLAGDRNLRGQARRDALLPGEDHDDVGNPTLAFDFAQIPNSGVGLARLEFIINNNIGVHPKAILDYRTSIPI